MAAESEKLDIENGASLLDILDAEFREENGVKFFIKLFIFALSCHGGYRWVIMLEKCGHPDLNVFHLKWIIGNNCNWKNQNPGNRFGATT